MEKISDNIYFISGPSYSSNSIVICDRKNILVDTGTEHTIHYLYAELRKIGLAPDDIDVIVNTHCHYDHIGGNRFFNCEVYAHEPDRTYIAQGNTHYTLFPVPEQENVFNIKDRFFGWRVIHTPGHTQGSICLFKQGILISGDTLFSVGHGFPYYPGGNPEAMRKSINKLSAWDYSILLAGHGPVYRKPCHTKH